MSGNVLFPVVYKDILLQIRAIKRKIFKKPRMHHRSGCGAAGVLETMGSKLTATRPMKSSSDFTQLLVDPPVVNTCVT